MSDLKEYKNLGITISEKEFEKIIKLFRLNYLGRNDLPNWKGNKLPAWCEFKEDLTHSNVNTDIFISPPFKIYEEYYMYLEFSKLLQICTGDLIHRYFLEKPEWINNDIYVFPKSMKWCLVQTHNGDFSLYSIND